MCAAKLLVILLKEKEATFSRLIYHHLVRGLKLKQTEYNTGENITTRKYVVIAGLEKSRPFILYKLHSLRMQWPYLWLHARDYCCQCHIVSPIFMDL